MVTTSIARRPIRIRYDQVAPVQIRDDSNNEDRLPRPPHQTSSSRLPASASPPLGAPVACPAPSPPPLNSLFSPLQLVPLHFLLSPEISMMRERKAPFALHWHMAHNSALDRDAMAFALQ